MLDIFKEINDWTEKGKPFALATVTNTWGSAPRLVGSSMAISDDMEIVGSVSGGCVEGDVAKEALEVLRQGEPKLLHYGVTDEDAWAVGLSCGGKIDVLVSPSPSQLEEPAAVLIWESLKETVAGDQGGVLLSRVQGTKAPLLYVFPDGKAIGRTVDKELVDEALRAYRERKHQMIELGDNAYFAQVFQPRSKMIIIGAAHISVDLVDLAHQFNFETIIIDPRGLFSNKTQFTTPPSRMHEDWPAEILPTYTLDPYTYAVVLTHDPKIDDQALHLFLRSEVSYIGALGGRKTAGKRKDRLREAGFSETEIDRIHGPVGIDINAKRPKEIALSIMAEIIREKNKY